MSCAILFYLSTPKNMITITITFTVAINTLQRLLISLLVGDNTNKGEKQIKAPPILGVGYFDVFSF